MSKFNALFRQYEKGKALRRKAWKRGAFIRLGYAHLVSITNPETFVAWAVAEDWEIYTPTEAQELGIRFKTIRESAKLTQENLARLLQLGRPTIAGMELGTQAITASTISKLRKLGWPIDYLFGGAER